MTTLPSAQLSHSLSGFLGPSIADFPVSEVVLSASAALIASTCIPFGRSDVSHLLLSGAQRFGTSLVPFVGSVSIRRDIQLGRGEQTVREHGRPKGFRECVAGRSVEHLTMHQVIE